MICVVFGFGPTEAVLKIDSVTSYVIDTFTTVTGTLGGQLFGRAEPPVSWQGNILGNVTYNDKSYEVGEYIYNHMLPSWLPELDYQTLADVSVYPRTYNVTVRRGIWGDIFGYETEKLTYNNVIRVRLSMRSFSERINRVYDIFIAQNYLLGLPVESVFICADLNSQAFTINNRYTTKEEFDSIVSIGEGLLDLDKIVPESYDAENFFITQGISVVENEILPKDVIGNYFMLFGTPDT